jgi:hypothetical protein
VKERDESWCPNVEFSKKLAIHNLMKLAEMADLAEAIYLQNSVRFSISG